MTKFIVNNWVDALQTDISLSFYDNKLLNCPLSLAHALHEFQIHVSVCILTIKLRQWVHVNLCSYRKMDNRLAKIHFKASQLQSFLIPTNFTSDGMTSHSLTAKNIFKMTASEVVSFETNFFRGWNFNEKKNLKCLSVIGEDQKVCFLEWPFL